MSDPKHYYNGKELHRVGSIDWGYADDAVVTVGEVVCDSSPGLNYTITFTAKIIDDGPGGVTWDKLLGSPDCFTIPACQRGRG
jgi:hypothetical protein